MQTFSILFGVRPSKINKDGTAPIEVTITCNGDRINFNSGRKCKPALWDNNRQLVKRDADTNNFLSAIKSKLYQCQTELFKLNLPLTANNIKKLYDNNLVVKKTTIIVEYHNFLKSVDAKVATAQLSSTSYNKHLVTIRDLKSYMLKNYNTNDIEVDKIDITFIDGFFTFLRNTKGNNTALKDVGRLKQVVMLLFNTGIINLNPFAIWKQPKEAVVAEFLTQDELSLIENKSFSTERLNKVRDVFVFACYTGLAYIDLASLTIDDIKVDVNGNKYIIKNRVKTGVVAKIPLINKALRLLEKYDYCLPVLSNQKYNCYLSEIGSICGIDKKFTTHTARHTCATMFLNNGIPIETVSKILGHSNITMTQHYSKLLDNTIMDNVLNSKLNTIII